MPASFMGIARFFNCHQKFVVMPKQMVNTADGGENEKWKILNITVVK